MDRYTSRGLGEGLYLIATRLDGSAVCTEAATFTVLKFSAAIILIGTEKGQPTTRRRIIASVVNRKTAIAVVVVVVGQLQLTLRVRNTGLQLTDVGAHIIHLSKRRSVDPVRNNLAGEKQNKTMEILKNIYLEYELSTSIWTPQGTDFSGLAFNRSKRNL